MHTEFTCFLLFLYGDLWETLSRRVVPTLFLFYSTALDEGSVSELWLLGSRWPKACLPVRLFVNKVLLVHSPCVPWHGAYGRFHTLLAESSSYSRDSMSHTNWAIWEARKRHKALDIHYLASYRKKESADLCSGWMSAWLSPRMLTIWRD